MRWVSSPMLSSPRVGSGEEEEGGTRVSSGLTPLDTIACRTPRPIDCACQYYFRAVCVVSYHACTVTLVSTHSKMSDRVSILLRN